MWTSVPRFFGLTTENKPNFQLEPIFLLMCYLGFSYSEARQLPIGYRKWFIDRVQREINKQAEQSEDGTTTTQPTYGNMPNDRAMLGRPPGRRRF